MTEKQTDRLKNKIEKYRKALASDKKYWGGQYHAGGGIRYLIPEQYIKVKDYKGGLRCLNWFEKNFQTMPVIRNFYFSGPLYYLNAANPRRQNRKHIEPFSRISICSTNF